MKNVQLIVLLFFINSSYSIVSAQNKKWEVEFSLVTTIYDLDQKPNTVIRSAHTKGNMGTMDLVISRTIISNIDVGIGIGFSNLSYRLEIDKTTHQLDGTFQYTARPDFSKRPQKLDKVEYNNNYVTVPLVVRYTFFKNSKKTFQHSIGLRIDNFFLQSNSTKGDFDGGGNFLEDFFSVLFGGQSSADTWDTLTASQRQETNQYFKGLNSSYAMNISLSLRLNWQLKKVSLGFEPFYNIRTDKVNKQLKEQSGGGVRTYFAVNF